MARRARGGWSSLAPSSGARGLGVALVLSVAASAGAACTGSLGDPAGESSGAGFVAGVGPGSGAGGGTGSGGNGTGELPIETAPRLAFPRLSHAQWENTVVDLFALDAPTGLSSSFYPDPSAASTFDNDESAQQVTEELWLDYQRAAGEVATMVASSPDLLARIGATGDAASWIESFGRRAYRRPLTAAERTAYEALFAQGAELDVVGTDAFVAGVKLVLEAMLQSPHFLYRVELGGAADDDGLLPLTPWEVATKLSYTLWNTMPDDALLDAAEAGSLQGAEAIGAEIDRLLASPRARTKLVSYVDQIFQADQFEAVSKSEAIYPEWSEQHGHDMREELGRFAERVMFDDDGGLEDLLLSRTTFVNARLAAIYGLEGDFPEDEMVEVELDDRRAGLLTLSGFLAWKGTDTRAPDTILRGVFVNRRILCADLPDPPDEAAGAELGDETTNRQKIEALTGLGTCGEGCHSALINPAGFAFESFDSIGAWRDEDAGEPIDSTGEYPFSEGPTTYDGAVEFSELVAQSPEAHRCWSQHWVEFTMGRRIADEDEGLVEHLATRSMDGASTRAVVREILTSRAFLTRKPAEVQP